jgi:hypothetical protein
VLLGPQGEPLLSELRTRPDSAVAAGTDRQELEYATGPQGEILYPLDDVCPTCGQPMPDDASQPGEDLSLDAPIIEDDITELSA